MRYLIIALVLVGWINGGANAGDQEEYCDSVKPKQYNDVWENQFDSEFLIRYDIENETFYFYSSETISTFGFVLDRAEAASLSLPFIPSGLSIKQLAQSGIIHRFSMRACRRNIGSQYHRNRGLQGLGLGYPAWSYKSLDIKADE